MKKLFIAGLLDVSGFEKFSTLIGASEEIIAFVSILLAGLFGQPTLITVGLLQFGIGMVFFIANIVVIYWKGWFEPYQKGMTGSFAFSVSEFRPCTCCMIDRMPPMTHKCDACRMEGQFRWFAERHCRYLSVCF